MEIITHNELEFEGKKHVYKLNGFAIPSVTTVMKPLSAFCYRGVDEESLRRAAGRGTAVHEAVENYLLFGIEDAPVEYEGYFQAFKKWIDERKPEVLATEHRLYHKYLMYIR